MDYNISDYLKKTQRLEATYRRLPNLAATVAVTFTKDRFRSRSWIDNRTEPWRGRKDQGRKSRGRALLVKSGRLKRSVRKIRIGPTTAVIGTDVPYARAHNYGFKGQVKVKSHKRGRSSKRKEGTGVFSIKTKRERLRTTKVQTGSGIVQSHTRNVTLPRRQFIGESRVLAQKIERAIASEIIKALK